MKKRIIVVFTSLLLFIPLFFTMPKADTIYQNVESVNYNGYQIGTLQKSYSTSISGTATPFTVDIKGIPVPVVIPKITSLLQLTFNFYQYRSFEIVLTFGSIFTSDAYFVIGGGTIVSYNSTNRRLVIKCTGTDNLTVCLVYPTSGPSSSNISYPSFSFNYMEEDGNPNVNIDYCEAHLRTMELNLAGLISYNSQSGEYSGYIVDLVNNSNTLVSTVNSMNSALTDMKTQLEIMTKMLMYNIEPYQHSAWFWCSKYDSSFPRWKYGLPYMQYNLSWNSGGYTASKSFRLSAGYSYIMVFYTNTAISLNDISVYYSASTGSVSISSFPINEISAQLYLQAFIFTNTNQGFTTFEPEINKTFEMYPLYFGLTNNIPDDINSILGREYDNTYTRLLQQIANGVGGSSYDTSEYEQYDQVVDNLNDSLLTDVNNSKNNILNDISNQSGTSSTGLNLNNVRIAINGLYNDIFTIFPALKYLVVVGLIILVLGVVL